MQGRKIILMLAAKVLDGLGLCDLATQVRAVEVSGEGPSFRFLAFRGWASDVKLSKYYYWLKPDHDFYQDFGDISYGVASVDNPNPHHVYLVLDELQVDVTKRIAEVEVTDSVLAELVA